jgi:hypothetical protein
MLFTKPQLEQLLHNGRQCGNYRHLMPVAKLFLPGTGCNWLLVSISCEIRQIAIGLSDLGIANVRMGCISLSKLSRMKDPLNLHGVQQDHSFVPKHNFAIYELAAQQQQMITDDASHLLTACRSLSGQQDLFLSETLMLTTN